MKDKESILKAFSDFLDSNFGGSQRVEVTKSLDNEQRKATFVVLAPEEVDGHGDIYSYEAVEKACDNYNTTCNKCNLEHLLMVDENVSEVVESYISPVDFQLDDQFIKKGTWLQTWKFNSEELWNQVKDGHWTGLSVQCSGLTEDLDEES